MHELAITESLLETVLNHGSDSRAKKIINIYLTIGELSSIVDISVQFFWDIVTKNTIAENSKLKFKHIKAEFICNDCTTKYGLGCHHLICPNCNSSNISLLAGDEFILQAIDIEETISGIKNEEY
jgi:hydrogenase nickel incorporation protein HypA/HybF